MKVTIKAQASKNSKLGIGRLKVTIDGNYHEVKAVVFTRSQASTLKKAADKSVLKQNVAK